MLHFSTPDTQALHQKLLKFLKIFETLKNKIFLKKYFFFNLNHFLPFQCRRTVLIPYFKAEY